MPVVPQITNPFQGKGYQNTLNSSQNRPGGEQFEIIQLTKSTSVPETSEREARQSGKQLSHNRADLPQLMVKTPKDPTMAVETLKQLISSDLLATSSANGYTELHGELESLSKSIYLAIDNLVSEMINQEKQTTMFSGDKLFDLLRGLAGNAIDAANKDAINAIANFLKAVNFSFNRDEILNALSANLKFLSTYFSPSQTLSGKLGALAESWASMQARENFELLKGETIKLLHNVSESLLNNEKTQVLIPLIIHNLSRYNTNDYMLKDAFSNMLAHVPHSQKGLFMGAFDEFLNSILYGGYKNSSMSSFASVNDTTKSNINQSPNSDNTSENIPTFKESKDGIAKESDVVKNGAVKESVVKDNVTKDGTAYKEGEGVFPNLYAKKLASGSTFPPVAMPQDVLTDNFADGLRGFLLGKMTGMQAITNILSNLIGSGYAAGADSPGGTVISAETVQSDANLLSALQADLAKMDSITSLVNYLNDILKQLPDVPERQILFEILSETISGMAEKGELPANSAKSELPQQVQAGQSQSSTGEAAKSSLEELTSFIEKNINHAALKTLDSYNASNLLQSLINAPGVHTPLSHFIVPLQIGDVRAFGELWVDNEEHSSSGGGKNAQDKNYHLFLTFEIEAVGRFETDLYAHGTQVSLAVLHPESFSGEMKALKEKVSRIIAATDYSVKEFQTGVLREPHDLTQIFPRIVEKRQGLDITV